MLSYWEKQFLLHYDVVIVGSGIVGLSTAISLKEKFPANRVLVLERGVLPTGASTKNAGFACIGSLTEVLDDLNTLSEHEVLQLVELRYKGLKKLRSRLGDSTIGYNEYGSYELISEAEEGCLNQLDRINELLYPVLGGSAFGLSSEKIEEFGFSNTHTKHIIQNNFEGELNTGKMMRALIDLALQKGIEIKTGCTVNSFEEEENKVRVQVRALGEEAVTFAASQLIICTNAFTKSILPEIDLKPGRGLVLITEPIADPPFKGIFHFDKGYYYFRNLDGRVLFGGGRNLDFAGEETTEFGINEKIKADLLNKLQYVILPGREFKIQDWWAGIMAFGPSRFPVVERKTPRVLVGVRMGGMGVAIGSQIGAMLAEQATL
jgi:gamma-glutamylputrescine oxidase